MQLTAVSTSADKQATVSLTVRLPVALKEHLDHLADTRGVTVTRVVFGILEAHRRGLQLANNTDPKIQEVSAQVGRLTGLVADLSEQLDSVRDDLARSTARAAERDVKFVEAIESIVAVLAGPADGAVEVGPNEVANLNSGSHS